MAASRVALVIALVVLLGSAAATDFLAEGFDAAWSNATDDPGPALDDVAWSVPLGLRPIAVFLARGDVFVMTVPTDDEGVTPSTLWRLDGETGEPLPIFELEPRFATHATPKINVTGSPTGFGFWDRPWTITGDGRAWYVPYFGDVYAIPFDGGEPLWKVPLPRFLPSRWTDDCEGIVATPDAIYVACFEGSNVPLEYINYVVALSPDTGAEIWRWVLDARTNAIEAEPPGGLPPCYAVAGIGCQAPELSALFGLSTFGSTVAVTEFVMAGSGAAAFRVWGVDAVSGQARWRAEVPPTEGFNDQDAGTCLEEDRGNPNSALCPLDLVYQPPTPTGDEGAAFVKLGASLSELNAGNGLPVWSEVLGQEDTNPGSQGSLARRGRSVYAASHQTLYRFDDRQLQSGWPRVVDTQSAIVPNGILLARETLFVRTYSNTTGDALLSVDAASGETRWLHAFGSGIGAGRSEMLTAISGERIAFVSRDGNVTLLGRTSASPTLDARVEDDHPAVGAKVVIDASRGSPGRGGPTTRYRVDWGDGDVTPWQPEPRFTHAFSEAGDRTVRVQAGNEANQTTSHVLTLHVGATRASFLAEQFAPGNQDRTFFLIGIFASALISGAGVMRVRRRRSLVRRELDAIDREFAATRTKPSECERLLQERATRAEALFKAGRIDEGQMGVLRDRTARLLKDLRVSIVDDELGFLPVRIANVMRAMLADGRVSKWERSHVLEALERDTTLTDEYKTRVRARVAEWFERDAQR